MKKLDTSFADVNLLVVEDYEFSVEILVEMLRLMGIEPDVARNGEEAFEKAKHKHYDIILMDILMPKIDGYESTRLIRELPIKQPIITALTAGVQQNEQKKCIDAGMDDFLSKPLILFDLENHLKKHLATKIVKKSN